MFERELEICQPGYLIKRTYSNESTFIYVCSRSRLVKVTTDKVAIEFKGIYINRPNAIFLGNISNYDVQKKIQTIHLSDTDVIEHSSILEMTNHFKKTYQKEIDDMYEQIKKTKEHIRVFKKTLKNIDTTMEERYLDALRLYKDEKEKSSLKKSDDS